MKKLTMIAMLIMLAGCGRNLYKHHNVHKEKKTYILFSTIRSEYRWTDIRAIFNGVDVEYVVSPVIMGTETECLNGIPGNDIMLDNILRRYNMRKENN